MFLDSHYYEAEGVTGQVNFTSHMDAVITVAVQLVNTLTAGEAHGRSYQPPAGDELVVAVSAALQEGLDRGHGRVGQQLPPVTSADAAAFGPVAAALREVFQAHATGDEDGAALRVNKLLASTGARPELRQHDGEAWHLHFPGRTNALVEGWAAGCVTGLAVVLGNGVGWRLGVCSAPRCDRVYVDTSRNGTRRFCSTACQNRVKAAAFRAKAGVPARSVTASGSAAVTGDR
jgi:predicted RNA-binding Zn ribbon-like protein